MRGLAGRLYSTVDAGNFASMRSFYTEDILYERPGYEPVRGIEQLINFYTSVRMIESGHHRLTRVSGCDREWFCEGVFEGRLKNGSTVGASFVDSMVLEEDRIAERRTYFYSPLV